MLPTYAFHSETQRLIRSGERVQTKVSAMRTRLPGLLSAVTDADFGDS